MQKLELWAGVECSLARVGDRFFDQLRRSGHLVRTDDLERIATTGARTVRYPVRWEHVQPVSGGPCDWTWTDDRLARLASMGIEPIVGLVHHGSGPEGTHLLDSDFAPRLAEFAARVARRYPWVRRYTPVNEPLTTARFAGQYGHWYPHGKETSQFVRALLVQLAGVRAAMEAIRAETPGAQLVQTEDLGKTTSTPDLAYQATFENVRRWLTYDLLTGRVGPDHRLWRFLRKHGADEEELQSWLEGPCPPDIVGVNHYVTSERFLDTRLERYPESSWGGNRRHRYADIEAVRVSATGIGGPRMALSEAWDRYRLPVAMTEAHLACTREEQVRWLRECWQTAEELRGGGADIRAVTVWALFGSFDWNSLLTRDAGFYEPGPYDLRGGVPRATALLGEAQRLAKGESPIAGDPCDGVGWWRRRVRLEYEPVLPAQRTCPNGSSHAGSRPSRPMLVTGAGGTLGTALKRLLALRGLRAVTLRREDLDVTDARAVAAALDEYRPWAVINAAGYAKVNLAERESERCWQANVDGPKTLARACAACGVRFLTFSTDLVFDGEKGAPYAESDPANPLNVYGASKRAAEIEVQAIDPSALLVRSSVFFGPWDTGNFLRRVERELRSGRTVQVATDLIVSPTYLPHVVNVALDLLLDGEAGVWHLTNQGQVSWYDLATEAARGFGLDPRGVQVAVADAPTGATRPAFSALNSERAELLPSLQEGIRVFFDSVRAA